MDLNRDKIGIIAGSGDLPKQLIAACKARNINYFVLAIEGQTDPDILDGHPHDWTYIGSVNKALKILRSEGCQYLVMGGYFNRPNFSELKPDLKGAKWIARIIANKSGDDAILRIIAEEFEREGFEIIGTDKVLSETLYATSGNMSGIHPSPTQNASIERGLKILRALGSHDVAQGIVMQGSDVLGIEAIEGTEKLIERCASYALEKEDAPILVKVEKTHQDTRFDQPTVGLKTLDQLHEAGFAGMALQANQVIMLDKDKMIKKANELNLFIVGLDI